MKSVVCHLKTLNINSVTELNWSVDEHKPEAGTHCFADEVERSKNSPSLALCQSDLGRYVAAFVWPKQRPGCRSGRQSAERYPVNRRRIPSVTTAWCQIASCRWNRDFDDYWYRLGVMYFRASCLPTAKQNVPVLLIVLADRAAYPDDRLLLLLLLLLLL